jgi:ribosome biogenesis GTPase
VSLFRLPGGGYVADTPGFREFLPVDLKPAELGRHYPEFRRVQAGCRYKDCLHRVEPTCGVKDAVESGQISRLRYENYLQILSTLVEV